MFLRKPGEEVAEFVDSYGFSSVLFSTVAVIIFFFYALYHDPGAVGSFFGALTILAPVWVPVYLAVIFWTFWINYVRYEFWFAQEQVLLKIELPPEVQKSPLAMELFLTALNQVGGEGTFIQRYWKGQIRPTWSLEIASNEGRVSFYIHLRKGWKQAIEAQLYGQFPEAKVTEVEDYVAQVPFNTEEYFMMVNEYGKTEAKPIKTYVDYKLDKDPDEWLKVDPLSNMLEILGNMGPGEYGWIQFILRARRGNDYYGIPIKGGDPKEAVKEQIVKITKGAIKRAQEFIKDEKEKEKVGARSTMILTGGEKDVIEAMERWMTKQFFESGVRIVHLIKSKNFNAGNIGPMISIFNAFKSENLGAMFPTRGLIPFNYPWEDWANIRKNAERRAQFFRFKNRAYFFVPYDQAPIILNTEELATLWHFPSSGVKTPGLERVASKRSDAPANLPIQQS